MTEIDQHNGVDLDDSRGPWILVSDGVTYSRFYLLDPRADEVNIWIIAHHLSHMCRFTGATSRFYSVAEHSIEVAEMVSRITADPLLRMEALLHDAAEAFVNDLAAPLKRTRELAGYSDIEERIWRKCIAPHFGLPTDCSNLVKEVDVRMCATEKRDLLPGSPPWPNMPSGYFDLNLTSYRHEHPVKYEFLKRYFRLRGKVTA